MDKSLNFKILNLVQGKHNLVVFCAPAKTLWEHFSINRRLEDKDEGYQRTLASNRVRQIAKYIDNGNSIPLSILVSLEKGKYKIANGTLSLNDERDVGWIIDGQHRLAGAHEAGKEILFPVVAFLDFPTEDQIQQFVTINREARGVPTSLYYDLLKHLPLGNPSMRSKDRAVDIANALKTDDDSPYYGRIVSTTAPKKGQLSLSAFTKHISSLVFENKGFLSAYSINEQIGIINNYYKAIKNVFPKQYVDDDSVFFTTTGFGALMRVLPTVLSISIKLHKGFTVDDCMNVLNKIAEYDFSSWKKMGTGNIAEIQAAEELRNTLEESMSPGDTLKIRL